uniref:SKI/SNO/DAC domain-containing protein n=1 Tax=Knipowitschia caucasica TaxID=637954 RepID=A0AAV2KPU8_KNICA
MASPVTTAGALSALSGFGALSHPIHHQHQHQHQHQQQQHHVQQSNLCSSECKLVEVHGVKVASFSVDGQELICLPQVFDLFLKHLVGGLHTVYTKLKRLDIAPVVCTVEQVRVLRGLGAIQPGVNRCKLISRKDFEALYQDCTSAR